jgi:hypothetical protein
MKLLSRLGNVPEASVKSAARPWFGKTGEERMAEDAGRLITKMKILKTTKGEIAKFYAGNATKKLLRKTKRQHLFFPKP